MWEQILFDLLLRNLVIVMINGLGREGNFDPLGIKSLFDFFL